MRRFPSQSLMTTHKRYPNEHTDPNEQTDPARTFHDDLADRRRVARIVLHSSAGAIPIAAGTPIIRVETQITAGGRRIIKVGRICGYGLHIERRGDPGHRKSSASRESHRGDLDSSQRPPPSLRLTKAPRTPVPGRWSQTFRPHRRPAAQNRCRCPCSTRPWMPLSPAI